MHSLQSNHEDICLGRCVVPRSGLRLPIRKLQRLQQLQQPVHGHGTVLQQPLPVQWNVRLQHDGAW